MKSIPQIKVRDWRPLPKTIRMIATKQHYYSWTQISSLVNLSFLPSCTIQRYFVQRIRLSSFRHPRSRSPIPNLVRRKEAMVGIAIIDAQAPVTHG